MSNQNPNFAALFDMDGLMVDTEEIQSRAYEIVMRERYGKVPELTEHGTVHTPGETTDTTWRRLMSIHGFADDLSELTDHKRRAAMDVLNEGVVPMIGLTMLFNMLKEHNIPIAVATSAQRDRAELILGLLRLDTEVDVLVTANDIARVKPAPDAYLMAADRLGFKPQECIVFEDAEVGVIAAKHAGAKVVAVPNQFTKRMDFSQADLVVESLADLTFKQLIEL